MVGNVGKVKLFVLVGMFAFDFCFWVLLGFVDRAFIIEAPKWLSGVLEASKKVVKLLCVMPVSICPSRNAGLSDAVCVG